MYMKRNLLLLTAAPRIVGKIAVSTPEHRDGRYVTGLCVPQHCGFGRQGAVRAAREAAEAMAGPTRRSLPAGAGSKPPSSGIG